MRSVQDAIAHLSKLQLENVRIVSVSYEHTGAFGNASDLPPFYRVIFEVSFEEGTLSRTELWLPDKWNGIFVGLGNGGMAGTISHEELAGYLVKDYAVAQTDMGTSRGRDSGIGRAGIWKDFGWRSTHMMTTVSKKLLISHYGQSARYAYFIGDSTGGQQAFSEAQRFPEDYDGIIAGVPANNRVFLHTYFLWNHNHLRTPDGQNCFTDDEIRTITVAAAAFFQDLGDGEPGDSFVSYPYRDADTVKKFIDYLHRRFPAFSLQQLQALSAVYQGPVNPRTGKQIYNGMPIGSEIYSCGIHDCQQEESPYFYPFIWAFGEHYNGYDFDFDRDLEELSNMLSPDLNANDADLTAFKACGGKLLAFSGSADPCVPYPDALRYVERVFDSMGGYDATASFFRYFIVPGRDHGSGGWGANCLWGSTTEQIDLLDTLRLWREKGEAPDHLLAARLEQGTIRFARNIYPYGSVENPKKESPKTCDSDYLNR